MQKSKRKRTEEDKYLADFEFDVNKFIALVHSRPALYNFHMKDHYNRIVLLRLWSEVGKEMETSVTECRLKWRSLRCAYARHMRKEKIYALSGTKEPIKTWYLAEKLSFLTDFVGHIRNHKSTSKSLSQSTTHSDENTNDSFDEITPKEEQYESDVILDVTPELKIIDNIHSMPSPTIPPCIRSNRFIYQKPSEEMMPIKEVSRSELPCSYDEEEGDIYYFRSLLPDVKKLGESRKRKFKQAILQKLYDLLDEQDDERRSKTFSPSTQSQSLISSPSYQTS